MVQGSLDQARADAPIDGVFATDDLAAAEVLEWARTRDLSVPGDLSIIGFDGTESMRRALPHLATIRQPIEQIARAAVDILLEQMEGAARRPINEAGAPPAPTLEFPGTLIRGQSLSLVRTLAAGHPSPLAWLAIRCCEGRADRLFIYG